MAMRRMDKYTKPAPAPEQSTQPQRPEEVAAPQGEEEKAFESERLMLFGPPETQKNILILAIAGMVVAALGFFFVVRGNPEPVGAPYPYAALIFVTIFGGLLGMLLGQLILVYPDRMIILFTFMAVVIGVSIYGAATWGDTGFGTFTRTRYQQIVGIAVVSAMVGFWIGFWFYVRQLRERKKFTRRHVS